MNTEIDYKNGIVTNGECSMGLDVYITKILRGFVVEVTYANDADRKWFDKNNVPDEVRKEIADEIAERVFNLFCDYKEAKEEEDFEMAVELHNKIEWELVSLRDQFNKRYDWKSYLAAQ